ncbi:MAG: alpha/beta hydrolase [Acidobacteriaceae bacterium]|nr:alpha/beta hydrolase [Acidobacteriaceae bacterium]
MSPITLVHLAADPQVIQLWPDSAPGEKATAEPERDTTTSKDALISGKPVVRLSNVTDPSLTIYPAPKATETGTAVVVFPGGGYRIVAMDLEGTEICQWLNSIGITAVLLKYRVPEPADLPRYAEPLQDAQRAMRLVRAHAEEWRLKGDRIGVLGFSAGGHLAAVLSSNFEDHTYQRLDKADENSSRPDFALLIYPAYLSVRDEGEQLAPEVKVVSRTQPMFIVQAEDDRPFIGGTLLYYRVLQLAGAPAEMHIYSHGGHGYGLRPSNAPVTGWPSLAKEWLRALGQLQLAGDSSR